MALVKVPPHARAGWDGRGHRFAAYPRCSTDTGVVQRANVRNDGARRAGQNGVTKRLRRLLHFAGRGGGSWSVKRTNEFLRRPERLLAPERVGRAKLRVGYV